MTRIQRLIAFPLIVLAGAYLAVAFVVVDWWWLSNIWHWTQGERATFLYLVVVGVFGAVMAALWTDFLGEQRQGDAP